MTTNSLATHTPLDIRIPHLRRILVPIDFSAASIDAFERAIDVAKIFGSSIVLAHVMFHHTCNGMASMLPGALPKIELDLQTDLDHLREIARDQGVPCTSVLRSGSVLDHVRGLVHDQSIDLLVIATHGGCGVHGVLLGSTAERLIRNITIPVLTVGAARNQPDWDEHGARHLLFAGDFLPETLCGLSLALGIQQTTGAHLAVVQAVPHGLSSHAITAISQRIQAVVPPGTGIYTPVGPVGRAVCNLARDLGTGLICLSVHKNSLTREVFGTGLLEILLNAPCPVLTLRECA